MMPRQLLDPRSGKRFNTAEADAAEYTLEFLTDNGDAQTADDTRRVAPRPMGLQPVSALVCSPRSDGMAESFVATF